ncbi:MAG: sulfite exporter TauE/SafE family protein [Bacteroidia bacterium]
MPDFIDILTLFAFGALGSFLSGFLGVGGGTIFIPVLDYYLKKNGYYGNELVKAILANSLFVIIFSGIISSYQHYKIGNYEIKRVLQTAIPGMFTAVIITYLIKIGNWYSKDAFNMVFAGMLLIILLRFFLTKEKTSTTDVSQLKSRYFNITGFFAGIITAMSGLGGGVIMTPIFTDILKVNIKKASGISNGVIPFFAISIGVLNLSNQSAPKISEYQMGYVVFPIVIPIIIASLYFARFGVKSAQKVNKQTIRITFATLSTIIFLKTLYEIIFS